MKRKDFYTLKRGITSCGNLSNPKDIEFVYRIVCINDTVSDAIARFEKVHPKNSDEYDKYLKEQSKILDACAMKNEDGTYVNDGVNVALANGEKYNTEMTCLKEKYKEVIEVQDKLNEKFIAFLEEEADDIKIEAIPKKLIPVGISVNQLIGIRFIIEK